MPYEIFGKLNNNEENLNHEHLSKIVYMHFFGTGFHTASVDLEVLIVPLSLKDRDYSTVVSIAVERHQDHGDSYNENI